MRIPVLALTALTALPLLTPAAMAADVELSPANPVVELSVTETVESAPDAASFSVGIQTEAPTAGEALRRNSAEVARLITVLRGLDIAERDLQTSGINLSPRYDYNDGQQRFLGYQVSNQLSVTVTDLDDLGAILDAVVTQGGATNLNGPRFFVRDDQPLRSAARARAVATATGQARDYATGAGYADVRLLSVSESLYGTSDAPEGAMMADASFSRSANVPVQGGRTGTAVTVNFIFEMVGE